MAELQPSNVSDVFFYVPLSFLYPIGPVIRAIDPNFVASKFSRKMNDYLHSSVNVDYSNIVSFIFLSS